MTDPIRNRIEFDAQTAASWAVSNWQAKTPGAILYGCTPSMVALVAVDAYRRARDAACIITTREQLDALPQQSVVLSDAAATRNGNPWPWERFSDGWFTTAYDPAGTPDLPARLLWHPDWSQS